MTLPREASKSTEALRALDGWHEREHAAIMASETLTPAAKQKRVAELNALYRERWLIASDAAKRDLEEWTEIYESRAASALAPKMPQDKDARVLKALELQRLAGRIEMHKEQPGRLLADYENAVRTGNDVIAHELEDALPALLPEDARAEFAHRAKENRFARMSEEDRKTVEEREAWKRQADATGLAIALQEANRQRGYTPAQPSPTTLVEHHSPGRPVSVDEVPNPRWRDPAQDGPVNEPVGGTIVPDPGSAA